MDATESSGGTDSGERLSKRRRVKTTRYQVEFIENEEHIMLQQALKISRRDTKRVEVEIPDAPVFYPTVEEFLDPIQYISKIREVALQYGMCKIVPPAEWNPPCQVSMSNPDRFPTKKQQINTLQEGQGFDDGKRYTIAEYKVMADKFYQDWCAEHHSDKAGRVDQQTLAKDYWNIVETNHRKVAVEYGNDLDTSQYMSGFPKMDCKSFDRKCSDRASHSTPPASPHIKQEPGTLKQEVKREVKQEVKQEGADKSQDQMQRGETVFDEAFYASTGWNLNNIPTTKGSLLQYLRTPINGINVPWLYLGMLFASFCWHNEDNYLCSISYNHFGATKQWYGVPGDSADHFEQVSKEFLLGLFRESPDLLHHMTTQVSPSILKANGVPVYKMTQEERTFIVTFPACMHGGFSYGFNCGEAVNFACSDWLVAGGAADERYRGFGRESVFSHQRLLFTLLHHYKELELSSLKDLSSEILRVVNEELYSRPQIYKQGVRDLTKVINLPANNFEVIDTKASEFDDMRQCYACKSICIFSAVACECDKNKVSCIRHFPNMCKCPATRKFMLEWASNSKLQATKEKVLKLHANR